MTLALAGGLRVNAVEIVPVYKASVMGGQYFLFGSKASLSGNAAALVAPVLTFSERWSLIPMYSGNYQGTKGVGDGVGSGTLFQQRMDHRASFTGLYSPRGSTWKIKPSTSYKRQFLKETLDETWGQGLFDFEKIAGGIEAENVYQDPFSYRIGFDFYRIRFPNFQSLEADAGTDPQGNPLGRENSSKNVLNTYNCQLSMSALRPFPYEDPKVSLSASFSSMYERFIDQRLVNVQGQYMNKQRRDFLQTMSLGLTYPRPVKIFGGDYRLSSSFGVSGSYNGSNQNTYDAAFTKFVYNSYSYYSWGAGPSLALAWGDNKNPAYANFSFNYTSTQYVDRLAQDPAGLYSGGNQWQDRYTINLGYSYPIAVGFNLKAQTNILWATSNNAYEKNYLYTYRTANYLMGFTYEY